MLKRGINDNDKSIIKQRIRFPAVKRLLKLVTRIQDQFKNQLKNQEVSIVCNFKKRGESRLKVSRYEKYY